MPGCGTGGLLRYVAAIRPDLILSGIEISREAARIASDRCGAIITVGSVDQIPYPDMHFDVVISADVLCHAAVEQGSALAELRRCLKSGGLLLLNLPAYWWMLSSHDRHVHNIRRYTAGEASQLVSASGFRVAKAFYWNSLLFPLVLLYRLIVARQQTPAMCGPFRPARQVVLGHCHCRTEARPLWFPSPFGGPVLITAKPERIPFCLSIVIPVYNGAKAFRYWSTP